MRPLSGATGFVIIFTTTLIISFIGQSESSPMTVTYKKAQLKGTYFDRYETIINVKSLAACGMFCSRRSTSSPPCVAFDHEASGLCHLYMMHDFPASPSDQGQQIYMIYFPAGKTHTVLTSQGNQYRIYASTYRKTYNEARRFCVNFGGYLLEFHTWDKYQAVRTIMTTEMLKLVYFVGANDIATENEWVYDKGSQPLDTEIWIWSIDEPNNYENGEDCAAMTNMELIDISCDRNTNFLCEFDG